MIPEMFSLLLQDIPCGASTRLGLMPNRVCMRTLKLMLSPLSHPCVNLSCFFGGLCNVLAGPIIKACYTIGFQHKLSQLGLVPNLDNGIHPRMPPAQDAGFELSHPFLRL